MAKTNRVSLPQLPSLPSSSRPRRLRACFCGCGGTTASTFCPGHDATLKAWVIRVERGIVALEDIGHAGLARQVAAIVALRASGKNVTFMRNVELPEPVEQTEEKEEQAS